MQRGCEGRRSVVPEAVGHTFEHFDVVVDAFDDAGVKWEATVGEDAAEVAGKESRKFDQWGEAAGARAAIPGTPKVYLTLFGC